MHDPRSSWSLETALEILRHPTVDSKTWSEAVEWLLLYGPPDLRAQLVRASSQAAEASFPQLTPQGYREDGTPCYRIEDLAQALDISMDEAARILLDKELTHGIRQLFEDDETGKLQ